MYNNCIYAYREFVAFKNQLEIDLKGSYLSVYTVIAFAGILDRSLVCTVSAEIKMSK